MGAFEGYAMKQLFYFSILYLCISLSVVADGASAMREFAVAGSNSSPAVCYNRINNQYLVAWFDGPLYFSILSASGARIIKPTPINIGSDMGLYGEPFCIYNGIDNQYCITWTAQNEDTQIGFTYFIIINSDGTLATKATPIPNVTGQPTANYSGSWVTHNTTNDQYLFTWLAVTVDEVANTAFAIYSAQGTRVVPATIIRQDPLFNTSSYPILSSYNSTDNQYLVTWMAIDSAESYYAYYAILDHAGAIVVRYTQLPTPASNNNAVGSAPPINTINTADIPIQPFTF